MTRAAVGLVLVAHSQRLADGLAEIAQQMAPDVLIRSAGGCPDGRLGTSFERVADAVSGVLAQGVEAVVLMTDLGSASLTAEAVIEDLDDHRASFVDAPLVEGTVAAAVAAQTGGDSIAVQRAARRVGAAYGRSAQAETARELEHQVRNEGLRARSMYLTNRLGLHARPAALLARAAGAFDAVVRVNGVPATSVLEVMDLALQGGAELRVTAAGPEADEALDAVEELVTSRFGEE